MFFFKIHVWRWCFNFSIQLLTPQKTLQNWTMDSWKDSTLRCGCTAFRQLKKKSVDILKIPKNMSQIWCKYVNIPSPLLLGVGPIIPLFHDSMVFWCIGNVSLAFCRAFSIKNKTCGLQHVKTTSFLGAQETNHEDLQGPNWTQQKQRAYPTTDCFASNESWDSLV